MAANGSSIGPYFIVPYGPSPFCACYMLTEASGAALSSAGTTTAAVQKRVSTFPSIWKLEQGEAAAHSAVEGDATLFTSSSIESLTESTVLLSKFNEHKLWLSRLTSSFPF